MRQCFDHLVESESGNGVICFDIAGVDKDEELVKETSDMRLAQQRNSQGDPLA